MYIEVKSIVWWALIFSLPESTINTSIYLRTKYLCIYHPLSTINQCLFLSYFEINCKKVLAFPTSTKHISELCISVSYWKAFASQNSVGSREKHSFVWLDGTDFFFLLSLSLNSHEANDNACRPKRDW